MNMVVVLCMGFTLCKEPERSGIERTPTSQLWFCKRLQRASLEFHQHSSLTAMLDYNRTFIAVRDLKMNLLISQ